MATDVYQEFNIRVDPAAFNAAMYSGAIAHLNDVPEMHNIVAFTRAFLEKRCTPYSPIEMHRHLNHSAMAELCSAAKRDYSRSSEAKQLWRLLFGALGFDAGLIARDRLVLRFQPPRDPDNPAPHGLSTATVGFHRDSWGTNLYAQVNWWAPVYPVTAGRTVALYPSLWNTPVANSSAHFDVTEAMRRVKEARVKPQCNELSHIIPVPLEVVDRAAAGPVVIAPGSLIAFSAQHAHEGVPNHSGVTRISLETRTLWIPDYVARRGAHNVDGRARWMTPGMFRRLSDGGALPNFLGGRAVEPFDGPWPN